MGDWLTSLIRGRVLDLALAVALGYGVALLAKNVADVPILALAQHVDGRNFDVFAAGVYLLNFKVGSTVIVYGEVLASGLAFGFVAVLAAAYVRLRDRELGACPQCASRIPHESTHCAYCGSTLEAAPS